MNKNLTPEEKLLHTVEAHKKLKMRQDRLQRLKELGAPEIIIQKETEMVAEAQKEVDEINKELGL